MSKIYLFILFMCCLGVNAFSQFKVSGRITDRKEGLPFATVQLLRADSSSVKGVAAGPTGEFVFELVSPGTYILTTSAVGYKTFFSPSLHIFNADLLLDDIMLEESSVQLGEVVVSANKLVVEQKVDRVVVNVSGSATSAGNSILEVLQKSPGVSVNKQANTISINGKSGVRVMVNGKPMQAPLEVVLQMLDGMSSSGVERIELITAPGAKYDAEGNGGVIHIVMKENSDVGTNGTVGAILGYKGAETWGGNFSINVRRKKFGWFLDYSGFRNRNVHKMYMYRSSQRDNYIQTIEDRSDRDNVTDQQNLSTGIEWKMTPNTTLNVGFTGYRRDWRLSAISYDENHVSPDSAIYTTMGIRETNIWESATGGIELKSKIDSKQEISVSLDYLYYKNDNPSSYDTESFDTEHTPKSLSRIELEKSTLIHFLIARADYRYEASSTLTFEAGIKGVSSTLSNDVLVQREIEGVLKVDPDFTTYSDLKEQVGAAYLSSNWKPAEKWQVNTGLRYEYTRTDITARNTTDFIKRRYGYFFPSLVVTRQMGIEKDLQFSYTRRIARPTYNDMAPFVFFWGPNTFSGGNTALRPAISDAIKVGYHIKQWIVSANFTHSAREINSFQPEIDTQSNNFVYRAQNLGYLRTVALTNSYSLNVARRWDLQGNLTLQYQIARASEMQNYSSQDLFGVNLNLVSILKLPKDFVIEVTGFYQTRMLAGITSYLPYGSLNAAIQKKFGNIATFTLAMDDILYMNFWRIKTQSPENNIDSYFKYDFHNQFIRLTITRNFGNKKLSSTKLKTGAEEERKRVGN